MDSRPQTPDLFAPALSTSSMNTPFPLLCPTLSIVSLLTAAALAQPAEKSAKPETLVPYPHPLITEVLYNVPTGEDGDASKDGIRSATGDEFVELVNPHSKPIQLKGYTLSDGKNAKWNQKKPKPGTKKNPAPESSDEPPASSDSKDAKNDDARVFFTFPEMTLKPGQVVVVFNGYKGPKNRKAVEGDKAEPEATKPGDGKQGVPKDATKEETESPKPVILSMNITSEFAAFNNTGDCVLLQDPEGNAVECISWGKKSKPPEDAAPFVERAPEGRGSVTRSGRHKGLALHRSIDPEKDELFSPGVFDLASPPFQKWTEGESEAEGSKPVDQPSAESPANPATTPKKPNNRPK